MKEKILCESVEARIIPFDPVDENGAKIVGQEGTGMCLFLSMQAKDDGITDSWLSSTKYSLTKFIEPALQDKVQKKVDSGRPFVLNIFVESVKVMPFWRMWTPDSTRYVEGGDNLVVNREGTPIVYNEVTVITDDPKANMQRLGENLRRAGFKRGAMIDVDPSFTTEADQFEDNLVVPPTPVAAPAPQPNRPQQQLRR